MKKEVIEFDNDGGKKIVGFTCCVCICFLILMVLLVLPMIIASQASSTNYNVSSTSVSETGGNASSTNYQSSLSVGAIADNSSSTTYGSTAGFIGSAIFPFCGDGTCDSGETCSSCVADCACSTGYTCTGGTCVADSDDSSSCSSGGGGGGGGGTSTSAIDFEIEPELYEKTVALERIETGEIRITNNEEVERNFTLTIETLEDIVSIDESKVTIAAGQTASVGLRITPPPETGIYPGKIIVTSGTTRKELPVIINVKSGKSLFDITLTIPRNMRTMLAGKNLMSQIDLLQMGIKEKMDVTLNYVIKDFSGNVYLIESETIAVLDQKSLNKEFHTEEFETGEYVLGAELIYPDGVAVASSQFKIKDRIEFTPNTMIMSILATAVIIVFIVIGLSIKRYKKVGRRLRSRRI